MSRNTQLTAEPTDEDTVQCLFFAADFGSDIFLCKELCLQINNTIKTLSKDYIWQRDEFRVYIPITNSEEEGNPSHLCSKTCFGDNIEDEWYIVHIVLEVSRQYPHLIIQMTDNDGDFLLIEAADHLQSWANPESTENRVFIHNGHIHIIPPEMASLQTKLDLEAALKIINASPHLTQASNKIEQAILNRIGSYPEKLLQNIHSTAVKLPSNLAALLIMKPSLIAPIVNAYCNHDVIDAKCCKNINFTDCVTIEVKFTKFLYATLMHSKLINGVKHHAKNEKATTLGVKLTCGYQMIMNKSSTDLFSSKEFHRFVESLQKNGYFKNNIEGSKDYNQLLNNAKEYFSIVESPVNSHLSHSISQLMLTNDYVEIKDTLKDNNIVEPGYKGDNEDWLNIQPDELNNLLLTRYGKTSKLKNNDVISSEAITTELSTFLKQTSDFEGIEPDHNEKSDDEDIDFESDQFVACIEKMLSILSTGKAESEHSDDDDDLLMDDDDDDDIDICDSEFKAKLQVDNTEDLQDSNTILSNIIQSMKEEKASTGPTSNLMTSMGILKSDLLDSDDDDDDDVD